MSLADQVKTLRDYFNSGATKTAAFRRQQLRILSKALAVHEQEIFQALQADLRKSPEESWATELGLIQSEIRVMLRNLSHWMAPEPKPTNLVNLPSVSQVRREPQGIVLIIGPWNYPFLLLLSPLVAAMAAGNCVILKAPELCPASTALMKKIIEENFTSDYILFLDGDGREILPPLISENKLDHIFFTGSTATGRIIYRYAADKLVPVTLELGGKSPCVVTRSADITVSAKRILLAKFSNAGQMCVAPDYVMVHKSVYDRFLQECIRLIRKFYGDSPETSPDLGRIINQPHLDRLIGMLSEGTMLHGGRYDREALFMEPTLISPSSMQTRLMQEEIFGPILPVLPFDDMHGALNLIRENPDPLAFYIFCGKGKEADAWLDAVPSGGACVNNVSWHLTNHNLPFGGRGNSGIGSYHGKYGFDRFSHQKAVMRTPSWFAPFIKYPPFAGRLRLFKWLIR